MSVQFSADVLTGVMYWEERLSGEMSASSFPVDNIYNGTAVRETSSFEVPAAVAKRIIEASEGSDELVHLYLLAGVITLLYKYNISGNIVVGAPTYRDAEGGDVNPMLVYTADLSELRTFSGLIGKLKKDMKGGRLHQGFPLLPLLRKHKIVSAFNGETLADVFVSLENIHGGEALREVSPNILFLFSRNGGRIQGEIVYNASKYSRRTVDTLVTRLMTTLEKSLADMGKPVDSFTILSEQELRAGVFSGESRPYGPGEDTVLDHFRRRVRSTPADTAILCDGRRYTYSEVDVLSNRLANLLLANYDLTLGDLVGVKLNRSEWMILSILSILKLGAAFIPIDPKYPEHRIRYIESDSRCRIIIDEEKIADLQDRMEYYSDEEPVTGRRPGGADLAYIIYTSGSTGKPKGVMIDHLGLTNYALWTNDYYFDGQRGYRFGYFTSMSFDLTLTSIFPPLLRGDPIFVFTEDNTLSLISQVFYETPEVVAIKCTPSHVNLLNYVESRTSGIQLVILGGEEVKNEHIQMLWAINPNMRIFNEYGPTETTVGSTCIEMFQDQELISIGRPVFNTSIYIVDADLNLLPAGITGEVLIGGRGVAKGYLNRPELTNTRFIDNVYETGVGEKVYRSGDVGKWLGDGNIQLFGRIDDQVKIRGYRIELGEVENCLLEFEAVNQAVVICRKADESEKQLIAYFQADDRLVISAIREFMEQRIPGFMVPGFFVQLDKFPLTHNGKIDKKALPIPEEIV